jgi:hypothetical protein
MAKFRLVFFQLADGTPGVGQVSGKSVGINDEHHMVKGQTLVLGINVRLCEGGVATR